MVLELIDVELFSFPTGRLGCNVIQSRHESSLHDNNKKKDISILGEGATQGLDDTTVTAEKKYSSNFNVTRKKFSLSLHDNGPNSYLFVNGTEIIKFQAKDSKINPIPLSLGSISKTLSVHNMKKTGYMDMFMILVLTMLLLQLLIYQTFTSI